MHVRHALWIVWLFLVGLLAPGCAAALDRTEGGDFDEPSDEAAEQIELFKTLYCRNYRDLVECMISCGKAGVGCSPNERHPYKDTDMGTLYACRTGFPMACVYAFPNGDKCMFTKVPGASPLCSYSGG